ncbi:MAG: Ig-like domain-containing protein [Gemmatimonadetes bacterium]|nr:Ig-like domain-containing protein [Gemmatimonadota bacterium]
MRARLPWCALVVLLLLGLGYASGCRRGGRSVMGTNVPANVVALQPQSVNIEVGETAQMTVSVNGSVSTSATIRSLNPAIASADPAARTVTGVSPGQTVVEAVVNMSGANTAAAQVTVAARVVTVDVSPATLTLEAGQQTRLTCTVRSVKTGQVVTDDPITWSSSGTAASVLQDGTVTAIHDGNVTITCATASGKSATAQVTVKTPLSVEIDPASATLNPGKTVFFTCTVRNGSTGAVMTGIPLTWKSSDNNVAAVAQGLAAARAVGKATVTCETPTGESASATVDVVQPAFRVSIQPTSATIDVGGSIRFSCLVTDSAGNPVTNQQIFWFTSNANVAIVGSAGTVIGRGPGTATITCKVSTGEFAQAEVTVQVME